MERRTYFESDADVEAHFAAQDQLWEEPTPQPPDNLWENMQRLRMTDGHQRDKVRHRIAAPNFSQLVFPELKKQHTPKKLATIAAITSVPKARALRRRTHKLKMISSIRRIVC